MNGILRLNDNSYLVAHRATTKEFHEDEIEVWLVTSNSKVCIFKDSLTHVIKLESSLTVKHIIEAPPVAIDDIVRNYIDYWVNDMAGDDYALYMLFDHSDYITWLSKSAKGSFVIIQIWDIDIWSVPIVQKKLFSYEIALMDFLLWWEDIKKL